MRKTFIVILVFSLVGLLPFVVLALFNQPVDDDYWYTWMANEYGFWGAIRHWAVTINGRYSSNAFMSLTSFRYGSVVSFKILPIITLSCWVAVIKKYTDHLFHAVLPNWQRLALAVFGTMVYYWNIPGINDGLFWAAAVACYQIPLLLFSWLFLWLIRQNHYPNPLAISLFLFMAAFIAAGFHEMLAFMAIVLGFVVVVFQWQQSKKIAVGWLLFITACASSLLVQLLCAGNHAKADLIRPTGMQHEWLSLLKMVIFQTLYQISVRVLLSPSFWLLAILLIFLTYNYRGTLKLGFTVFNNKNVIAFWVLLMAACFFPAILMAVVAGDAMPPRVSNVTYFVFLTGCLLGFILMTLSFAETVFLQKAMHIVVERKTFIVGILLMLSLPASRSLRYAANDIFSGLAYRYNQEITGRLELLKACEGGSCTINSLNNKPLTLYRQGMDASENKLYLYHLERVYRKKITVIRP